MDGEQRDGNHGGKKEKETHMKRRELHMKDGF
jgi:hypothetical protein